MSNGIEFTPSFYQYAARALALGAMEGPLGAQKINPNLEPLLDAIHHVLAGGQVAPLTTTIPGNSAVVAELKQLQDQALKEANDENQRKKPDEPVRST